MDVVVTGLLIEQLWVAPSNPMSPNRKDHPEVEHVFRFGSWLTGLPTPGSNVGLCPMLPPADRSLQDRVSDYWPVGLSVGICLFAYTPAEFEPPRLLTPGWHAVVSSGLGSWYADLTFPPLCDSMLRTFMVRVRLMQIRKHSPQRHIWEEEAVQLAGLCFVIHHHKP